MIEAILNFLASTPSWYSNGRQSLAVGAILIWKTFRRSDDPETNKWLARVAIKMQTYF